MFTLGVMRGVKTGCALVASNNVGDESFIDSAALKVAILDMVRATLDALVEFTAPGSASTAATEPGGGQA